MTTKIELNASASLLEKAWSAGPGWRGKSLELSTDERDSLMAELFESGLDVPSYLQEPTTWVVRRAKLFEAGEFPDKGLSITLSDLQELVEGLTEPIPIWIEHAESPLALGYVTNLWVEGNELFGETSLTAEANSLIEQSGAHSLSVGLAPDLKSIREVSLVTEPRIEDARIFRKSKSEAQAKVDQWVRSGKLWPGQAALAEALLRRPESIPFSGSTLPLGMAIEQLIEAGPGHTLFRQQAPIADQEANDALLLPEEADFYRRHFPDLDLGAIAARRNRS